MNAVGEFCPGLIGKAVANGRDLGRIKRALYSALFVGHGFENTGLVACANVSYPSWCIGRVAA